MSDSGFSTSAGTASPRAIAFAVSQHSIDELTSIVAVEGELDLASAPTLKWSLTDVLDGGARRVVVDLSMVTFIDSTALGVLVAVQRHLDPGVRIAIAGATGDVLNIFELTGLDATFQMRSTVEEALASVRGATAPG